MKKSTLEAMPMLKVGACVAALMSMGVSHAQSAVTMFGIVDVAVTHGSGSISSKTALTNSAYGASQLGFQGVEDLGGGLRAGFWLEAGLTPDDGQGGATNTNNQASGTGPAVAGRQGLTFGRRSTVSIGGNWGELRLGHDYVPSYWNLALHDPWGDLGVGGDVTYLNAPGGATQVRASNSIQYLYGHTFNSFARGNVNQGFHGAIAYYMGENNSGAATSHDGNGVSGRIGYNAGPLSVALGLGKTKYLAGDVRQGNIGGSYDFGVVRLVGHYSSDKFAAVTGKGFLIGGWVPVGPHMVRFAYSTYKQQVGAEPTAKKISLGYIYNLSKRSALYASAARVHNSGGAALAIGGSVTGPNTNSSGFDLGIRHSF